MKLVEYENVKGVRLGTPTLVIFVAALVLAGCYLYGRLFCLLLP
jgi:hypothetical protein